MQVRKCLKHGQPRLSGVVVSLPVTAVATARRYGYTREIGEDGQVTLRLGEDVIWKRRCISKSENEFVLEGNLVHKLIGDTLHIEGKYKAVKE